MELDVEFSPEILGKTLARARKSLRISLRDLSKVSGVSPSQILRIESGEFDCLVSSLVRLGVALGIRFTVLLEHSLSEIRSPYQISLTREVATPLDLELPDTPDNKEALKDLVLGGCSVVTRLMRSANPVAVANELEYPSQEIEQRFMKLAGSIAAHNYTPRTCVDFITTLQSRPFHTLRSFFNFPTPDNVREHAAVFRSKRRALFFPWMPIGRVLFFESEEGAADFLRFESKNYLTIGGSLPMLSPMPTWDQLKVDVRRLAKPRGSKAALARHCQVTRQAVATWLDTESTTEPGATATLKLLQWVEAAKARQQKSSGTVAPAPEPKTQRKGSNETTKPKGRKQK